MKKQKAEGWDLIKVMPGPSTENYDSMAKTAKEVGIPFAGHVPRWSDCRTCWRSASRRSITSTSTPSISVA